MFDFTAHEVPQELVIIPNHLPHPGKYLLVQPTEGTAVKYRNQKAKGLTFVGNNLAKVENPGDIEPLLVSWCLFQVEENSEPPKVKTTKSGLPVEVSISTIHKWPAPIIRQMFDWVKKVGQLDEKETEESLNKKIKELQDQLEELKKEKNG